MTEEKIARINALAKKSKTTGLTEAEKAEQQALRREYLDEVAASAVSRLRGCPSAAAHIQNRLMPKGTAAKRCIPPFFARQTVLYYNSIGACRKGSEPVRFTQGSVSRARCTEKAVF